MASGGESDTQPSRVDLSPIDKDGACVWVDGWTRGRDVESMADSLIDGEGGC